MHSKRDGESISSMMKGMNLNSSPLISTTDINSLPDELLSDILVRLPADHIHNVARLVCLRWSHIVHSPYFVKTQIQHSTYGLILYQQLGGLTYRRLITATEGGRIEKRELSCSNKNILCGSCNGLTLNCNSETNLLHILNPATKQELVLPVLPSCSNHFPQITSCGIAYAAASMEYKVVVPFKGVGHRWAISSLGILSVGVDESWRNVSVEHLSDEDRYLLYYRFSSTEGSIHWAVNGSTRVLTLDVETETFRTSTIPLPKYFRPMSYFLSTGRFLSLLVPQWALSWEVWGMGSRDGEWSKVLPDIELGPHKLRLQQFACREDLNLIPLGWVKYPEVLSFSSMGRDTGGTCIFFNLETREIDSIELPTPLLHFSHYVHKNNMAWYV